MIHSLRGKIVKLRPWEIILDVNGVGYFVRITLQTYEKIQSTNLIEVFIHSRVIYRENEQLIYGFLQEEEAELFDFLRSLQGIGPQLAGNLISTLGTDDLLSAIEYDNHKMLIKVPKVGKNMAEKILFEAKNKQKKLDNIKAGLNKQINKQNKDEKTDSHIQDRQILESFNEQLEEGLSQLGFQKKRN